MNNFTPNRLTAGNTGAGQFTYKTNSESDLELEDDIVRPIDEYVDNDPPYVKKRRDLLERISESDRIITSEVKKDPTIGNYAKLFENHRDLIFKAANYRESREDNFPLPGGHVEQIINDHLKSGKARPEEIGGMRVTVLRDGKAETVEVFNDDYPGQDAYAEPMSYEAAHRLGMTRQEGERFIFPASKTGLDDSGIGCHISTLLNKKDRSAEVVYAEVSYLPSRRSTSTCTIQSVRVPSGDLHPDSAHLWVNGQETEVYLEGDKAWVYVVPGHRTELSSREVDIARKQILKDDFIQNHDGASNVADGWL